MTWKLWQNHGWTIQLVDIAPSEAISDIHSDASSDTVIDVPSDAVEGALAFEPQCVRFVPASSTLLFHPWLQNNKESWYSMLFFVFYLRVYFTYYFLYKIKIFATSSDPETRGNKQWHCWDRRERAMIREKLPAWQTNGIIALLDIVRYDLAAAVSAVTHYNRKWYYR